MRSIAIATAQVPATSERRSPCEAGPRKSLGLWRSWAIVVGSVLGSAIFMEPSLLAPYGGLGLISLAAAAFAALCVASTLAVLARTSTLSGGIYAYAHETFGDWIGFLNAWTYWIALWTACAAITIAFTAYLAEFFPSIKTHDWATVSATLTLIWILIAVNTLGVRESSIVNLLTTIAKLLPLIAIGIVGLRRSDANIFPALNPTPNTPTTTFVNSFAISFWMFTGLEQVTVPSQHVLNPSRTVPRALMLGTCTVAIVYLIVTGGVMGVIPSDVLLKTDAPLTYFGRMVWGYRGATLITFAALLSTVGCLNITLLAASQTAWAAAANGVFPVQLASLSRFHTPGRALVATGLLVTALTLMNFSHSLVQAYTFIILISTLTTILPYGCASVAALGLQVRRATTSYRQWSIRLVASIAMFACAWVTIAVGLSVLAWTAVLILSGVPVFLFVRQQRTRRANPSMQWSDGRAAPSPLEAAIESPSSQTSIS